ncbi:MAG TPA: amidohydrolase family protein [Anaerolineae bacterium]|nr:amidohydrolase family protein [Anaerolineae bacterium]HQH39493.1 amidohydrolase family protein [Anaerolineae bacterium]
MDSILGHIVYTGTDVLENVYVNMEGATIAGVTPEPAGALVGEYPVITPAFIDAHSHIGMSRAGEPSAEAETNEHMDAMLPHADALDSVQMDDSGFMDSIEAGVLYSCVVPGSGNIIGGNSAVIRNYGKNTSAALIRRAGIKAAFGYNPMSTREWKGTRPFTRMGALAILRAKLHDVRQKMAKEKTKEDADVTYSAEEMVYKSLLSGAERLRVHVHKSDDVAALLRFVDEFGLKVTIEHTCDVHEVETYRELKARGIPVIYGPMDTLAYKVELKHENWRNIKYLIESGVEFGLMTDHPVILQKMLFFELRWFLRMGFSKQQALEIITRENAKILGVADILGTLAPGKWASFVGWNGDPFSLESYPLVAYGEGQPVYREA